MGTLIAADDLTNNDYVAVHSPKSNRPDAWNNGKNENHFITEYSPVPPGYPLRVIGLSLPFAACCVLEPGGRESAPMILDLRNIQLCRLSNEFVNSIASFQSSDEE